MNRWLTRWSLSIKLFRWCFVFMLHILIYFFKASNLFFASRSFFYIQLIRSCWNEWFLCHCLTRRIRNNTELAFVQYAWDYALITNFFLVHLAHWAEFYACINYNLNFTFIHSLNDRGRVNYTNLNFTFPDRSHVSTSRLNYRKAFERMSGKIVVNMKLNVSEVRSGVQTFELKTRLKRFLFFSKRELSFFLCNTTKSNLKAEERENILFIFWLHFIATQRQLGFIAGCKNCLVQ